MRSLGYSTILLTAALVVAPACSKKDETSGDAKTADAKDDKAKQADAPADAKADAKPAEAPADAKPAAATPESVAAAPAVAGALPSSVSLIPDQAQFIAGMNFKALTSSPLYAIAQGEMDKQADYQEAVKTLAGCGLDPMKFDSVVGGVSPMDENVVIVVVGDGVGDEKNATCLINVARQQDSSAKIGDVTTEGDRKFIAFDDGRARAYLVDARTVVLVTNKWDAAVTELIDGKGTAAATNSKKDLLAKVNGGAAMWGVGTITPDLTQGLAAFGAPPEFSDLTGVAASIDMSGGFALDLRAIFSAPDKAASVAEQLKALLPLAAAGAPELAETVNKIKVEAAGNDVTVAMSATVEELEKARKSLPPM